MHQCLSSACSATQAGQCRWSCAVGAPTAFISPPLEKPSIRSIWKEDFLQGQGKSLGPSAVLTSLCSLKLSFTSCTVGCTCLHQQLDQYCYTACWSLKTLCWSLIPSCTTEVFQVVFPEDIDKKGEVACNEGALGKAICKGSTTCFSTSDSCFCYMEKHISHALVASPQLFLLRVQAQSSNSTVVNKWEKLGPCHVLTTIQKEESYIFLLAYAAL